MTIRRSSPNDPHQRLTYAAADAGLIPAPANYHLKK
jgi:hypothetical protein